MVAILFLLTFVATIFGIYLILALSYNLEYGYGGLPNLGQVFFYSIGAYVAGVVVTRTLSALAGTGGVDFFDALAGDVRLRYAASNPGIMAPLFAASLGAAMLAGGAFGYVASYPALRLRGDSLAIVLIAVGEVGRVFVRNFNPIAGGVFGLPGVPSPFGFLGGQVGQALYAVLVLAIAAAVYLYLKRLTNSPYGRLLKSLRDDELVADVLGKRTAAAKGKVMIIGSALAGLAGGLYAFYVQSIFADDFIPIVTFIAVAMVMVGGVANHLGVVAGAGAIMLLDTVTRPSFFFLFGVAVRLPFDLNFLRFVLLGLLIVLVLLFRPEGLVPEKPVQTPALEVARVGPGSR